MNTLALNTQDAVLIKNLNKVRVITICYIEILFQVVFIIWFLYTALYWAGNNIHSWVDLIQLRINLH